MRTWDSFQAATITRERFQTTSQAIRAAVKQLTGPCAQHEAIVAIVLFGSVARRRRSYDDIDLLIVSRPTPSSPAEVTRQLAAEVFGPLFLEYGELFSFIVYTPEQIAQLQGTLPLLDEIQREGVLLYGQDPFVEATSPGLPAHR